MTKHEIRKMLLAQRASFSEELRREKTALILSRLLSVPEFQVLWQEKGRRVGLYRGTPQEMNLRPLEALLEEKKCQLCFPRVTEVAQKAMEFVPISSSRLGKGDFQSAEIAWRQGAYGIEEPAPQLPAIAPEKLDWMILPGLGFGERGERIGMGAGYYDRFLPKAARALRIALAFDFQIFPKLEQEVWDQPVHWVLTESRFFITPAGIKWRNSGWF